MAHKFRICGNPRTNKAITAETAVNYNARFVFCKAFQQRAYL